MNEKCIPQRKQMAMGKSVPQGAGGKFARGGSVPSLKTGIPDNPITDAKRANGVKGIKNGGKVGC